MTTIDHEKQIELSPISNCRSEVEIAMVEMLVNLQKRGWQAAELALALADASEELVMLMANKMPRSH
ncbi:hypothetical protein ATY78_04275 [Rhizobium sp. R635]|uniref:hypothetical protein n=1 Tax=unclassified Rhizobium TaxID=2613769 RepID=UPI000B531D41|nr:hypothetical protein [Rhizobium sp. R635]OWV87712.1 hypothetical protein ATY78_04275 [Rhizobium sp. R635]